MKKKKIKKIVKKVNVTLTAKIEYTYKWAYNNTNQFTPMFYARVSFTLKEPNVDLMAFLVSRNKKIWAENDKIGNLTINPEEVSFKIRDNTMLEITKIVGLIEEFCALDNLAKELCQNIKK